MKGWVKRMYCRSFQNDEVAFAEAVGNYFTHLMWIPILGKSWRTYSGVVHREWEKENAIVATIGREEWDIIKGQREKLKLSVDSVSGLASDIYRKRRRVLHLKARRASADAT